MFGRSSGCSFVARMAEFSFVSALGLAFFLVEVRGLDRGGSAPRIIASMVSGRPVVS